MWLCWQATLIPAPRRYGWITDQTHRKTAQPFTRLYLDCPGAGFDTAVPWWPNTSNSSVFNPSSHTAAR
jgi:hypothetical protein